MYVPSHFGKFKLSQNREVRDRVSAGKVLIDKGESVLGQAMLDIRFETVI